jgi:hypothetical protein
MLELTLHEIKGLEADLFQILLITSSNAMKYPYDMKLSGGHSKLWQVG